MRASIVLKPRDTQRSINLGARAVLEDKNLSSLNTHLRFVNSYPRRLPRRNDGACCAGLSADFDCYAPPNSLSAKHVRVKPLFVIKLATLRLIWALNTFCFNCQLVIRTL